MKLNDSDIFDINMDDVKSTLDELMLKYNVTKADLIGQSLVIKQTPNFDRNDTSNLIDNIQSLADKHNDKFMITLKFEGNLIIEFIKHPSSDNVQVFIFNKG